MDAFFILIYGIKININQWQSVLMPLAPHNFSAVSTVTGVLAFQVSQQKSVHLIT